VQDVFYGVYNGLEAFHGLCPKYIVFMLYKMMPHIFGVQANGFLVVIHLGGLFKSCVNKSVLTALLDFHGYKYTSATSVWPCET